MGGERASLFLAVTELVGIEEHQRERGEWIDLLLPGCLCEKFLRLLHFPGAWRTAQDEIKGRLDLNFLTLQFPEAARKRAVEVMRLGYLIAWDEERFDSREGAAPELADIWRGFVLPRVVVR